MQGSTLLVPPPAGIRTEEPVLELRPDLGFGMRQAFAIRDLREGLRLSRLIWALGCFDIVLRDRGSVLGPFWLILSTAIMIAALGFLCSAHFHGDLHSCLPLFALSMILCAFLSIARSGATAASPGAHRRAPIARVRWGPGLARWEPGFAPRGRLRNPLGANLDPATGILDMIRTLEALY